MSAAAPGVLVSSPAFAYLESTVPLGVESSRLTVPDCSEDEEAQHGPLVTVSWRLRYAGPRRMTTVLEARYRATVGAELRATRLLYCVFVVLVFGTGLVMVGSDQVASLLVSVLTALVCGGALAARPGWAEGVTWLATSLLVIGLDLRQTVLMSECGGCPDLITLLGVMPFLHCANLSPCFARILPVLVAHAGYAGYLFLSSAPTHGGAKTAVMTVCVLLTCVHLYVAERTRRDRVLLSWRLERAIVDRTALATQREHARALEAEMSRFEAAVAYICHELRNPVHGLLGAIDWLLGDAGTLSLVRERRACCTKCCTPCCNLSFSRALCFEPHTSGPSVTHGPQVARCALRSRAARVMSRAHRRQSARRSRRCERA